MSSTHIDNGSTDRSCHSLSDGTHSYITTQTHAPHSARVIKCAHFIVSLAQDDVLATRTQSARPGDHWALARSSHRLTYSAREREKREVNVDINREHRWVLTGLNRRI